MLNWRETGYSGGNPEMEAKGSKGLIFKVRINEDHRGVEQYYLTVKNPHGFFDVQSFTYNSWNAAKAAAERLDKGLKP